MALTKAHNRMVEGATANIIDFGADPTGATDSSTAIQAAINSSANAIFIPNGNYLISSTITADSLTRKKIYSDRARLFTTSPLTSGVFRIIDCTDLELFGVRIEGPASGSGITTGYEKHGIYASGCDGLWIRDCEIFKMDGGGLLVLESVNVRIEGNHCYLNESLFDIAYGYASTTFIYNKCFIDHNICESANQFGVHVMGVGRNVFITNNHIANKYVYGIMVYKNTTGANTWSRVVVSGNTVDNISYDTITPSPTFLGGMGIYLQTVERATVTGNVVTNVLQNRPDAASPNRTLAPAAISLNGVSESTCSGNTVLGSGIDGIDIVNVYNGNRGTTISGNTIIDAAWHGIYVNATQNISVTGNSISGKTTGTIYGSGISVQSHSAQATGQISISSNAIKNGFNTGIVTASGTGTSVDGVSIVGNEITDVVQTYLQTADTNDLTISNNVLRNVSSAQGSGFYGLQLSTCTNSSVTGNVIAGDSTNKFSRGLAITNSTDVVASSNSVMNIDQVSYAVYLASNTNAHAYLNKSENNTSPVLTPYNIGNDPSTDTNIRVVYVTSVPTTGTFARGSIAWNIEPSAGGAPGWICVATGTPGTWKAMASVAA
jgi:parallel beta-helix repeat protein